MWWCDLLCTSKANIRDFSTCQWQDRINWRAWSHCGALDLLIFMIVSYLSKLTVVEILFYTINSNGTRKSANRFMDGIEIAELINMPATFDHVPLLGCGGIWSNLANSWYSSTRLMGGWTWPFLKSVENLSLIMIDTGSWVFCILFFYLDHGQKRLSAYPTYLRSHVLHALAGVG